MSEILELKNVSVHFPVKGGLPFFSRGMIQAVSDVSLTIKHGETFGVVGESGCGKTTLANAMIGMVKPTAGQVLFKGVDLNGLPRDEFKKMRRQMQMIFQDPYSSLNPRFNVYQIVSEPMFIRGEDSEEEMKARVVELLELVGLSAEDLYRHPSDFSGGQRQRIGIARAISLNPSFLVCDEPVSALDVSIHAQILNLLVELQERLNLTYVFISHNLADVKKMCDRMAVMYLGKIMESGDSDKIFRQPLHPYTQALLAAVLDTSFDERRDQIVLQGDIPSPINPPAGCRFWQRCPKAMEGCKTVPPELIEVEEDHFAACHLVNGFPDVELPAGCDEPVDKEDVQV
ncbi:MAG: ABC transporter ATP-binding protein [Bacillota bacterium]|jgi:oligopeptide transport system ATP-binding protein|nr:ABC transporter ATP-binding protein [Bacillota bacterium]NLJ02164.1 ABC transporter ATP-binding protein [Bacillota bacterium]